MIVRNESHFANNQYKLLNKGYWLFKKEAWLFNKGAWFELRQGTLFNNQAWLFINQAWLFNKGAWFELRQGTLFINQPPLFKNLYWLFAKITPLLRNITLFSRNEIMVFMADDRVFKNYTYYFSIFLFSINICATIVKIHISFSIIIVMIIPSFEE